MFGLVIGLAAGAFAQAPEEATVTVQEEAPPSIGAVGAGASVPWTERARSALGLLVMVAVAWALSSHRGQVRWPIVAWGLGLQLTFGVLVLKTAAGAALFRVLNDAVVQLLDFTNVGTRFLAGPYLDNEFTVGLNVLPIIIFFSSLMTLAYHLGLVQPVVSGVAWVMQRTLGTSGAETLSAAANIFVGQTEAPLVVRPFVSKMTESELMAVMTGGFATVAGSVLGAYVGMLNAHFPDIGGHLIAASVMSAPAALLIAKVMVPETETPETEGTLSLKVERTHANVIDAAAGGAADGMKLALNVAAMLLAFLALVAMANFLLALPALWHNQGALAALRQAAADVALPSACDSPNGAAAIAACLDASAALVENAPAAWHPVSLEGMLGWLFWPFAWVMGVPAADCAAVGALLGEKVVLTEFVAYVHLAESLADPASTLSPRAALIATYALCGFANFGSIAIQIGGIGGIAPDRRADLARLGVRAMIGGSLAAFMTACVAGLLI